MIDLHSALVDCSTEINTCLMFQKQALTSEAIETKLKPARDAFMRRRVIASIYLDEGDNQTMNAIQVGFDSALKDLHQAFRKSQPHGVDDSQLLVRINQAVGCIRRRLSPATEPTQE